MSRPPVNLNNFGSGFLGLDTRKSIILGVAGLLALVIFLSLARTAPFVISIGLAVFVALMGIAFSFGQINGQTVEEWLWTVLSFKRNVRYYHHRHEEGAPEVQVKLELAPAEKKVVAKQPVYRDFFFLTANALAVSVLVMLALWYVQGGGAGLSRTFQVLFGGQ